MLENKAILVIEISLRFEFPTINNQSEYKAFIDGLTLEVEMVKNILSYRWTQS